MNPHTCKFCGTGLVKESERTAEEFETYDPDGFRKNLECPGCHSVFGMTKSSLTPICQSLYVSPFAEVITLTQKMHLWKFGVRTKSELFSLARQRDVIAIGVIVAMAKVTDERNRRLESKSMMVDALAKCWKEKQKEETFYFRGVRLNTNSVGCFLKCIDWEEPTK